MYFSEICTILFSRQFFHFLYLFKMWEIFMPHFVYAQLPRAQYVTCAGSTGTRTDVWLSLHRGGDLLLLFVCF